MSAILHMLAGLMGGKPEIAQKGYGHVYAEGTAALQVDYSNVDDGSAPAPGDLVIWLVSTWTDDEESPPLQSFAGAGWVESDVNVDAETYAKCMAKVVSPSDLSDTSNISNGHVFGANGLWFAYSVAGLINALSVNNLSVEDTSGTPSNQPQNSSGGGYEYVVTLGVGYGTDDSPTLSMSGATPDINFAVNNHPNSFPGWDFRVQVVLSAGGANITFSKSDDGLLNSLISCHVGIK